MVKSMNAKKSFYKLSTDDVIFKEEHIPAIPETKIVGIN